MSRGGLQKKTGLTKAVRPVKEATDEDSEMTNHRLLRILTHYDRIITILDGVTGSRKRALASAEGMKLEAYYGACFASTTWLGRAGGLSNKAFQRNLNWLEDEDLIERERRVRPDKTLGTYRIWWTKLWILVSELLDEWNLARQRKLFRGYEGDLTSEEWFERWNAIAAPAPPREPAYA
jgi:hypothetical protein